jgi:hypothetical protein
VGLVLSDVALRGKRDNFFLASQILGAVYPDLTERTHRPFCDFFVQKNFNKPFSQQDIIKNRLLMAPRGHFKTSLDLVDCISWMLNFPNVTILMLSGSQDVATRMVEELKQIFLSCTDFRALYPDYIPNDNVREFGAKGEFWLPRNVRTRIRREPTLSISTLDSVKASTHYDIRIGDDVITEVNSRINPNQRVDQNDRVADDWQATRPLLNPGGYTQIIGTFYNFACLYGKILDRLGLSEQMRFGQQLHEVIKGWKIAVYPAVMPDGNGKLFNKDGILFPEKFCINSDTPEEAIKNADKFNLQDAWEENPTHFNAQYMNHPIGTERDYFPIELLQKQTIPRQKVPLNSVIFGVWDLAYKQSSRNDYTVGAIGAFDELKNIYIIDLFRGRWNPPQIIDNIISAWKKWPIQRMGIEQAVGATLLGPGLNMRQRELGLMIPIDWLKVSNKKDATVNEILSLATLLGKPQVQAPVIQNSLQAQQQALINLQQHDQPLPPMGKLFFCQDLPFLAELYTEFSRFGGGYGHDDIPRAVSLLLRYHGMGVTTTVNNYGPVEIGGAQMYGDEYGLSAGLVG